MANMTTSFCTFREKPIVMKKAFLLLILVVVSASCQPTANKKVLRHVVSFKFSPETTDSQIAGLIEAFQKLPDDIPQIKAFEWGLNNSPEGYDKGMTHIFLLTFDNAADRDIYLPHPAHKAFGDAHGGIIEDLVVVDYLSE